MCKMELDETVYDSPGAITGTSPTENVYHVSEDAWKHRSASMRCPTCMWYVHKGADIEQTDEGMVRRRVGRCRKHAPTLNGWPVMYEEDFCGDHKIDETKI